MEKVLAFADDLSSGADTAWAWVCAQSWPGWRVDVVTVDGAISVDSTNGTWQAWVPGTPRQAPDGTAIAGVQHLVVGGDARSELAAVRADLMVAGPRGTGILKRLHIGSVVESLLGRSISPLLIARDPVPVRHALLAVDGSVHARQATELLGSMPWLPSVHVTVIGVDEGDHAIGSAVDAAANALAGVAAGVDRRILDYDEQSITVNVRYQIDEYLKDHHFDLLVLGTKGLHGVERLRLGSVADYFVHHAPCSVLLVHDESAD